MVSTKSVLKLFSIMILSFGAVFICSIFFNYSIDLKSVEPLLVEENHFLVFEAITTQNKVTMASAGGMLGAVTMIVLLFSIARYIGDAGAELGVMKALGYSENRIALRFAKFGLAVLIGTLAGYAGACIAGQVFYNAIDSDGSLPERVRFSFHVVVPLLTVAAPTFLYGAASVLYALLALRKRPLDLISGAKREKVNALTQKLQGKPGEKSFKTQLRRNMLFSNLVLIFFVGFAAFGFSMQTQMAFTMYEATKGTLFMPIVFVSFGLMLGFVTLHLALSFVFKKNAKYLALLKAYGYTGAESNNMLFGGYRIVTYVGFAIGTVYQYFFMKLMIGFFADAYEIPALQFPVLGFFICLAVFVAAYELMMFVYKQKIERVRLQQIMQA